MIRRISGRFIMAQNSLTPNRALTVGRTERSGVARQARATVKGVMIMMNQPITCTPLAGPFGARPAITNGNRSTSTVPSTAMPWMMP